MPAKKPTEKQRRINRRFGNKLRDWRKDHGNPSQDDIAIAAGLTQTRWSELELGNFTRVSLDEAERIVKVTNGDITMEDFPRPPGPEVKPLESSTDLSDESHARAS
jgi:transcriptional regulator with XRE-family HTH domain